MFTLSQYLHDAALLLVGLALVAEIFALATRGQVRIGAPARERELVGAGGSTVTETPRESAPPAPPTHGVRWYSARLTELALACLTVSLVARMIVTGHAPFANQYEFGASFVWGILAVYVYFAWRYQVHVLAVLVLPLSVALLLYTSNLDQEVAPLIPALQNSLLLTLHVLAAVIAYGAAAVSFAAAVLYLVRDRITWRGVPSGEVLEEIGYRATVLNFPMLTLMLILGALWADIAWGRYWSWDPKETAALVTWFIYGAYLHARVVADWRGRKAAYLLLLAFGAVVFTFLGNHFFGGLHSYA